jgi:hypothetical protein
MTPEVSCVELDICTVGTTFTVIRMVLVVVVLPAIAAPVSAIVTANIL